MREVNQQLDPFSKAQMFEIVAREAIEGLEKAIAEQELRIATLEDARQRQIRLNQELLENKPVNQTAQVKSNWWPW